MSFIVTPTANGTYPNGGDPIKIVFDGYPYDYGSSPGSEIAKLVYLINGNPIATHLFPASEPTGEDPQGPVLYSAPAPGSGSSSVTLRVEVYDAADNEITALSKQTTLYHVDGTRSLPATNVTGTSMTLNGEYDVYAGDYGRFLYGTTPGGPYTETVPAVFDGAGHVHADISGLDPGQNYYYVFQTQYDPQNPQNPNEVIGTSTESSVTTLAAPEAVCSPASSITTTTATLNGTLSGIPVGGSARFRRGTVPGGPYPTIVAASPYANGATSGNTTGLTAGTTYYYVLEIRDSGGNVVAMSDECTFDAGAAPSATCEPATNIMEDAATLNGTISNIPAGGSVRFRYGATPGTHVTPVAAAPYADGAVSGNNAGFFPNTTYYYVTEILNSSNQIVAQSAECSFTTLESTVPPTSAPACPPPDGASSCPPIATYSVGGAEYAALDLCDDNGPLLAVYQICNGLITGEPTYYDLDGAAYTPVGDIRQCSTSSGGDFEQNVFCDQGNEDHPFISRIVFSEAGDLIPEMTGTFELDQVTPYNVVGPAFICQSGNLVTVEPACIFQENGLVLDHVEIVKVIQPATGNIINIRIFNIDRTVEYTLPLPAGNMLGTCDPEALCTPDPALNLNAECGTWEPVNVDYVALPDANVIDDPTADALCDPGGTWPHDAEDQPSPFPIRETFRTNTYNDPNWVEYDAAHLTSGVEDTAGQGWLQLTTNAGGQRGAIINQTAFPTATANFVAEWTAAVRNPGPNGPGDGFGVMFLDGTQPMPPNLGGGAGAFSYTPHCGRGEPGIRYGVFEVAMDIWGEHGTDPANGSGARCTSEVPRSVVVRGSGDGVAPCDPSPTAYPCLGTTPMPFDLATHGRANPAKIRVSFITEGGQSLLSVQMAETTTSPFITVIDRLDVSADIALPASLRIGFVGASGGLLQEFHEIRDMAISSPVRQYWRALNLTSDEVPECATNVSVSASVDVKITQDTQTSTGGDAEPEHHLRLVNSVTGEIYDAARINSAPTLIGETVTMSVDSGPIPVADLPNVRIYFGDEVFDVSGGYGALWSNLQTNVLALGCPPRQVRTIPISAPCPIPVTIVGGLNSSGEGSGGSTVFNSAPTIDFEEICADGSPAFRREVRNVDGTTDVDFIGADGNQITPTTWTPGSCGGSAPDDVEFMEVCADGEPAFRKVVRDAMGVETVTFEGADGAAITPTAWTPGDCPTLDIIPICFVVNASPFAIHAAYKIVQLSAGTTTTLYYYESDTGNMHQPADVTEVECVQDQDPVILCDDNGPFLRHVIYGTYGNIAGTRDTTLDGAAPYVPVGTVVNCGASSGSVAEFVLCDDNGSFVRKLIQDENGEVTTIVNLDLEGAPYAPVGTVVRCDCVPTVLPQVCSSSTVEGAQRVDNWLGSTLVGNTLINNNFDNTGQTVSITQTPTAPSIHSTGGAFIGGGSGPDNEHVVIDLGAPRANVEMFWSALGTTSNERLRNISPPPSSVTQSGVIVGGNGVNPTSADGLVTIHFDGPVQIIEFDYLSDGGGQSVEQTITYTELSLDGELTRLNVIRECDGTLHYYSPVTGDEVLAPLIVDCPEVHQAEFVLCDDNGSFIRKFIQDADGAVTATVDLDLTGASYTPVGTVVRCMDLPPSYQLQPFCFIVTAQPGVIHAGYAVVGMQDTTATTLYYYEIDTGAVHQVADVVPVACVQDQDPVILCDDNGPFLRHVIYSTYGDIVGTRDTTLDGLAPYVPVGTVVNCGASSGSVAEFVLCDDNGSFVRKLIQDETGAVTAVVDLDLAGAPYAPVGTVKQCQKEPILEQCYQASGTDCSEDTAQRVLWQNTKAWDSSNPDWNNALSAALIGGSTETFVNTQLTGITSTASVPTPAGLVRWTPGSTFLEEVIAAGASPVVRHDFTVPACAITSIRIFDPNTVTLTSDVPINVTHNTSNPAIQGSAPIVAGNGTNTVTVSTADDSRFLAQVNGASFVTVRFTNNTGAQDSFDYGMSLGVQAGGATYRVTTYDDNTQTIVNTADPNDRPTAIDPTWVQVACNPARIDTEVVALCDDNGGFLRWIQFNEDGIQVGTRDTDLAGAEYEAVGTVGNCGEGSVSEFVLCDSFSCDPADLVVNGDMVPADGGWTFVGHVQYLNITVPGNPGQCLYFSGGNTAPDGVASQVVTVIPGNTYTFGYTYGRNGGGSSVIRVLVEVLDTDGVTPLYSQVHVHPLLVGQSWQPAIAVPGLVPTGNAVTLRFTDQSDSPASNADLMIDAVSLFCTGSPSGGVQFVRKYIQDRSGAIINIVNLTLDGEPYTPTGSVMTCGQPIDGIYHSEFILCDDNGPFIRTMVQTAAGEVTSVVDTDLEGDAYTPVGTVASCPSGATGSVAEFILCDDNGSFIRKLIQDESGAVTATVDLDLAGAPYVPVGTVTSCATTPDPLVLTSHHKDLVGGVTWTPADVSGTLLSLTYTVLANAADNQVTTDGVTIGNLPTGFSTTWSAQDENNLTGPTLVDAGTAGRIYVSWVEK